MIDNCKITTEGVARPALFVDEYAKAMIMDSEVRVMGGTLYEGYRNTADQAIMVAPPWVLGITGNARGTNMEGNLSSTTVAGSKVYANQWGSLHRLRHQYAPHCYQLRLTLLGQNLSEIDAKNPFTKYGSGCTSLSTQEYFCHLQCGFYASILTGGKGYTVLPRQEDLRNP